MFEQLLLLTTVMLGVTVVRLVRRLEAGQRGYMLVVAAVLAVSLAALAQGSRFLGIVAIAFGAIVVIVPWVLEVLARTSFSRARLGLAVRLAGVRALLMPGAGLSRQQEILHGLALLERDGVDRAIEHFRELADDAENNGQLALINEQIISMLFYGQRWDEGIAHYEARFHPRYAAMRPSLALSLLRAYGESGRLDTAAGLLRALEEGPVGTDPRATGLVSQARLTFLAYAGAATPVVSALTDERRRLLGLSEASSALFRGIAFARAGESQQARLELRRVEELATGSDERVLHASRNAMATVDDGATVELGPALRRYVDTVAQRLEMFLRAAPKIRRPGALMATPALLVALVLGHAAVLAAGRGGMGLLSVGALTPELWQAGSWGRAIIGAFVQADPVATLLNLYAVWIAGPLVERIYGAARVVLVAVGGAVAGLVMAAMAEPEPAAVLAGGNLLAAAVTTAALWTLLPARTPGLSQRMRRGLAIPLVLVLLAQAVSMHRGLLAMDVSAIGLLVAAATAIAWVGLFPMRGSVARLVRWLAIPLIVVLPISVWKVAREDIRAYTVAHRSRDLSHHGVRLQVPESFELTEGGKELGLGMPMLEGVVDTLALRTRQLVQIVVTESSGGEEPSILSAEPTLRHGLDAVPEDAAPVVLARAYAEAGGRPGSLRSFSLRMGGRTVARVVEVTGSGEAPHAISLVSAPAVAVEYAPVLYATVLAEASTGR